MTQPSDPTPEPDTPPAPAVPPEAEPRHTGPDREQVEAATRIVLEVIDGLPKPESKSRLTNLLDGLQRRWPLIAIGLSLVIAFIAWAGYGVSLFQPLEEKAFKQAEYRLKQNQQRFKETMLKRQLALGKSLLDIGKHDAALAEYEDALKLDPASTEAQLGRLKARIFALNADQFSPEVIEKRIQLVRNIARENSADQKGDDAHARSALGDLYAPVDEAVAMGHYRAAIAIDSSVATARFGLSWLLDSAGELDGAIAELEAAAKISPLNPAFLNNLGYLYTRRKSYTKALAAYGKARRLDPAHLITYCEQAHVYLLTGKTAEARQALEDLVWQMRDETLMKQPKNNIPWLFPTDDGPLPLSETNEKQRYCWLSLALARFLTGDAVGAEQAITEATAIHVVFPEAITAIVRSDLKQLETAHDIPDTAARDALLNGVRRFREMFVVRLP